MNLRLETWSAAAARLCSSSWAGRATAVITERGRIACDAVVLAAGAINSAALGDVIELANGVTFTGNKAVTNVRALRASFILKDGDWFNATLIGKGLEQLKKSYGQLGYINFGAIPKPVYDEQKKTVSLQIDIDEGGVIC
jgi:hypothetical protein